MEIRFQNGYIEREQIDIFWHSFDITLIYYDIDIYLTIDIFSVTQQQTFPEFQSDDVNQVQNNTLKRYLAPQKMEKTYTIKITLLWISKFLFSRWSHTWYATWTEVWPWYSRSLKITGEICSKCCKRSFLWVNNQFIKILLYISETEKIEKNIEFGKRVIMNA